MEEDRIDTKGEEQSPKSMSIAETRTDAVRDGESDDVPPANYYELPFPVVLHDMLCKESQRGDDSPVFWVQNGEAFVLNEKATTPPNSLSDVLLRYFKHGRYTSIQRQLNLYGWKKHLTGRYKGAFYNPLFHRDKPEDIAKIKRRTPVRNRNKAKLGTRKRKAKRRHSEASESSTLLREAALVNTGNTQETYYYGSDLSDNASLLGDEENENVMMNIAQPKTEIIMDGTAEEANDQGDSRALEEHDQCTGITGQDEEMDGDLSEDNIEVPKKQAASNKIVLPFSLKHVMLKEWEHISQRRLVPTCPASVSVRRVLDMYVEAKRRQIAPSNPNDGRLLQEDESIKKRMAGWKDMAEGIALFFDKALASRLLYPQELPQLKALTSHSEHSKKRLSDIYGCEHLLRLLLRLPDILAECVTEDKRKAILEDMKDFVRFLHQHQDSLFSATYHSFTKAELYEHKHLMASISQ